MYWFHLKLFMSFNGHIVLVPQPFKFMLEDRKKYENIFVCDLPITILYFKELINILMINFISNMTKSFSLNSYIENLNINLKAFFNCSKYINLLTKVTFFKYSITFLSLFKFLVSLIIY